MLRLLEIEQKYFQGNMPVNIFKNLDLKEIDIAAEKVRRSIIYIDGINQKFDIEKILDIIFSDFCIGK